MKNRKHNYTNVEQLPDNAITVAQYAEERVCNTSYIYKLARFKREGTPTEQDINFNIVVFKGINFVIKP